MKKFGICILLGMSCMINAQTPPVVETVPAVEMEEIPNSQTLEEQLNNPLQQEITSPSPSTPVVPDKIQSLISEDTSDEVLVYQSLNFTNMSHLDFGLKDMGEVEGVLVEYWKKWLNNYLSEQKNSIFKKVKFLNFDEYQQFLLQKSKYTRHKVIIILESKIEKLFEEDLISKKLFKLTYSSYAQEIISGNLLTVTDFKTSKDWFESENQSSLASHLLGKIYREHLESFKIHTPNQNSQQFTLSVQKTRSITDLKQSLEKTILALGITQTFKIQSLQLNSIEIAWEGFSDQTAFIETMLKLNQYKLDENRELHLSRNLDEIKMGNTFELLFEDYAQKPN